VCGDFNDTPNSYVYRILSDRLQDSFKEKGLGIGTTFAGSIPLLRIDYILADMQFKINECKVIHNKWSDHYPVVTEMQY
jgi:endonuclease/exonuclease/phosphatase family metal-dependent hydrolase